MPLQNGYSYDNFRNPSENGETLLGDKNSSSSLHRADTAPMGNISTQGVRTDIASLLSDANPTHVRDDVIPTEKEDTFRLGPLTNRDSDEDSDSQFVKLSDTIDTPFAEQTP